MADDSRIWNWLNEIRADVPELPDNVSTLRMVDVILWMLVRHRAMWTRCCVPHAFAVCLSCERRALGSRPLKFGSSANVSSAYTDGESRTG